MKPRKILVGIDEPDDVDGVLEFAAAEAVRRQCGVHLMHAVSAGSRHGVGSELTITSGALQHAGSDVLVKGAQQLEDLLHDELSVTTELVHDSAASALNEASTHACLVLLQRRDRSDGAHGLRSVINGVAAHAGVPVMVVPSSWRRGDERTPVVVGVGEPAVSGPLVSVALEMARQSDTDLRLLHARPDGLLRRGRGGRRPSRLRRPARGVPRRPHRLAGGAGRPRGHVGRRGRHRLARRGRPPPPPAPVRTAPRLDGPRRPGPCALPGDGRGAGRQQLNGK